MEYLKEVELLIKSRDLVSLKDFAAKHTAKIHILNVLGQDSLRKLGPAMDTAGLAFVPKSVVDCQHQKVILPARYDFISIAHSFLS